jgi:uncharacterized membrane protein YcaP (DUF421 family)
MWDWIGGDKPSDDTTLLQWALRTAIVYIFGLVAIRFGKRRLLGRSTALDIVLGFILGSLLSRGINGSATFSSTLVAVLVLILLHSLFSFAAYCSDFWGWVVKGSSTELSREGKLIAENMRKTFVSHKDVELELRLNGNIGQLSEAEEIFLERNGEISVVKRRSGPRVIDVQVEEGVKTVRIRLE